MDLPSLFPPFRSLSATSLYAMEERLQPVSFSKAEVIVRESQVQKKLYLLEEGILMSYLLHKGKQHVTAFIYPPGIAAVPESFFSQQPSASFVECLSDVKGYGLAWSDLAQLFDRSPETERLFRKTTEAVLAGLVHRYNELQTLTIEERFRSFTKRSPHLLQMVPHKFIASYLHIDPTNFSKLYNSVRL